MTVSPSVRGRVYALTKIAEEELERECPRCGVPGGDPDCKKCDDGFGGDHDSSDTDEHGNEKESMGMGSMDTPGRDVYASANLTRSMHKTAEYLEYCAVNIGSIVDNRPTHEKVATVLGYQTALMRKHAEEHETSEDDFDLDVNIDDDHTDDEQDDPHDGKELHPFSGGNEHELATNEDDDYTSEEWEDDPMADKKASVTGFFARRGLISKQASSHTKQASQLGSVGSFFAGRGLLKRANDPSMAPPPPGPQGGGAPPPDGGAPMPPQGMQPPMPPPPPPGPDPMQVAMALQSQGTLTPESLAQAAGISPQEAASIIAAMAGGTGAQPPMQPPMPPGGMPAGGGEGGPAPAGGDGMTVQASANPAALFQAMLRKYAGEEMSHANISAGKSDTLPWEADVKVPSNPGREYLASNEAAINFTSQQARRPRDEAVATLFENKVPYKRESGTGDGAGKMDEFVGDKTSSARIRSMLKAARAQRPLR